MAQGVASEADLVSWLLEPSNSSVRFRALQDLEGRKPSDQEVRATQNAVMESPPVKAILDRQSPEGHWGDPRNMYLPKYTATTHSLLILAELGARRTPAIERGIEHMFLYQRNSGHFFIDLPASEKGRASAVKDGCCLDGNVLYYLVHFGYLDDPRTRRLLDFTVDYHSADVAGWKCRSYPINPGGVFPANCYMGAA